MKSYSGIQRIEIVRSPINGTLNVSSSGNHLIGNSVAQRGGFVVIHLNVSDYSDIGEIEVSLLKDLGGTYQPLDASTYQVGDKFTLLSVKGVCMLGENYRVNLNVTEVTVPFQVPYVLYEGV